jgi:hypothetical protein
LGGKKMKMRLVLLGLALLSLGLAALLVFLASITGHPPYTGIGVAILPVSLLGGIVLIGGSILSFILSRTGKSR